VEGFTSQLSDVDTTEFKRTAHLNQTLQKDLSSYATAYRNVLSDYVTAQSESQKCKEDCSTQYPPPGTTTSTAPSSPSNEMEYMVGYSLGSEGNWGGQPLSGRPGPFINLGEAKAWCRNNDDCKGIVAQWGPKGGVDGPAENAPDDLGPFRVGGDGNGGKLWTTTRAEEEAAGSIYFEGEGQGTTLNRGARDFASWCKGGCMSPAEKAQAVAAAARAAAEAAAEDEASRELAINKKQACLAGCGLSKAYLEETNITGTYNNETITDCSTLGPECSNENVEGCTTCEECYAKGPGYWCADTGTCSTHGNPCTGSCGDVCTANNVETCTTCESCYAQGPGYWCADTGTCSTHGNPCTGSCGGGGLQTSRTIDTILRSGKQLVDSCNKSKNATQIAQNTEMDGRNLTQEYSALNEKYLRATGEDPNAELRYMPGYNLGTDGYYGGERLAGSPTETIKFSDAIEWCRNNNTCKGVTISHLGVPGDNDEFYPGGTLFFQSSNRGPVFDHTSGSDSGWSSWCKGGCGQSVPQTPNILLGDTGGISSRIDNILSNRRGIQTNSRDSRQNLESTLKSYKAEYNKLQNREQDGSTLSAMMSEGKLKKSSASLKYLVWLGLAICMLMMAIRQLKK